MQKIVTQLGEHEVKKTYKINTYTIKEWHYSASMYNLKTTEKYTFYFFYKTVYLKHSVKKIRPSKNTKLSNQSMGSADVKDNCTHKLPTNKNIMPHTIQ